MYLCNKRKREFCLLLLLTTLVFIVIIYNATRTNIDKGEIHPIKTRHQKELFYLPAKDNLPLLPHSKLAALYHRYISELQVGCDNIIRLGEEADGGWDVCDDKQYRPGPPCLVYSFGIDFDFSFDDAIAKKYDCEVHSFDPSMKMEEKIRKPNVWFHPYAIGHETQILRGNNWPMYRLADMLKKFGHKKEKLTVLKLDVEEWEMFALPQMISDGSIRHVKQLLVEFHITTRPEPNKQRYIQGLNILIDLYNLAFRIFWTKRNLFCRFTSREDDIERTGCHEVSFVNMNHRNTDL